VVNPTFTLSIQCAEREDTSIDYNRELFQSLMLLTNAVLLNVIQESHGIPHVLLLGGQRERFPDDSP
jgi:hypothetical protein